jgi:hypothetical protein
LYSFILCYLNAWSSANASDLCFGGFRFESLPEYLVACGFLCFPQALLVSVMIVPQIMSRSTLAVMTSKRTDRPVSIVYLTGRNISQTPGIRNRAFLHTWYRYIFLPIKLSISSFKHLMVHIQDLNYVSSSLNLR